MTYKIEKNIPLNRDRYPFLQMEIGDSFLVTDGMTHAGIYNAAKRKRCKIAIRTAKEGFRVWLVEKDVA